MLTYAYARDFEDIKKIDANLVNARGARVIADYLRRATAYIDMQTARRFYPFYETRLFSVDSNFADMRRRAYIYNDILLDSDLLEPMLVQTTPGTLIASGETVPAPGLTALDTTFTATDAGGVDADGNLRFAVGNILQIDNERLMVRQVVGNVVTVERGAVKTMPAAHSTGAGINKLTMIQLAQGIGYFPMELNIRPFQSLRVVWPNTWSGGSYLASPWYINQPQVFVSGLWGWHEQYPQGAWINTLETLQAELDADSTTITLSDVDGTDDAGETRFLDGYLIRIDNELLWVSAVDSNANTITVYRGRHGSLATTHPSGTPIYRYAVPEEITEACLVIAKTFRDADAAVGGRQGVTDMSEGVEIAIPKDQAQVLEYYRRSVL